MGLLFPGMPLRLKYGWNSTNTFLDFKTQFLLSINGYDLNIDTGGQIELSIQGYAYNEKISTILIGDIGEKESDNLGISRNIETLKLLTDYFKDAVGKEKEGTNNYKVMTNQAEAYDQMHTRISSGIASRFSKALSELITQKPKSVYLQKGKLAGKTKEVEFITFHDILQGLCGKTFESLPNMIPGVKEFQIIYGNFNKNAIGPNKEQSIADFPINREKFCEMIRDKQWNGESGLSIKVFIDELISTFLENKNYWLDQNTNPASVKEDVFHNEPDIAVNFFNNGEVLQMTIIDVKANLPVPTVIALKGLTKASTQKAQDKILENFPTFPIIQVGNSNSFIKKISLGQVADPQMKALMIERMFNGSYLGKRQGHNIVNAQLNNPIPATVPVLPLQGSMTVLGHPGWLPNRAFFLSTGMFAVDAIYVITQVRHTLQREGFDTEIQFFWH